MAPSVTRPVLRRAAIVEQARALVSRDGLEGLTLRRLADVFGVSAPALYAHFTDKKDLLRAIAEREFEQLISDYARMEDELDLRDPLDRIRAQCRRYIRRAQDDPELFRVMFLFPPDLGGFASVPEVPELPAATRAFDLAVDAVRAAIAADAIQAEDPMIVAMTLWAGAHGLANMLLLGLELPPTVAEALIEEVTDRTLQGYGARASASKP
jgi:AcrR family transcriptional regulator